MTSVEPILAGEETVVRSDVCPRRNNHNHYENPLPPCQMEIGASLPSG